MLWALVMILLFSCYYILIVSNDLHDVNELKHMLENNFNIQDLNVAKKIIGIEIHKDRSVRNFWLS